MVFDRKKKVMWGKVVLANGRGREVKERVGWERERDPHNRHSQLVVSHPHMAF